MSGDVLARILSAKRARVSRGEYASAPSKPDRPSDGASFVRALRAPGARIVGEIKRRSPSAGEILPETEGRLETIALMYRRGHAAALSVVTEQDFFGGRPEWLPRAKRIAGLPALMKDFVVDEAQLDFAAALGADAILLIARALSDEELSRLAAGARARGLAVVAEAHDADEIRRAAGAAPDVLGVNARDLATFAVDLARLEALAASIPPGPVRLAESGIRTREDVSRLSAAGYGAFLVGETLLRAEDPVEMLKELAS
ncbi:MAG TPA: indole-3-glycerol-phosphate synthase [Thermoanaerobaculia bacterium]|jgi:indole-3-glycerol phosphate synthase